MADPQAVPEIRESNTTETVYAAIADKVRADSQSLGRLTHVEDLGTLFPDMTPEQVVDHLGELIKIEEYKDVKVLTSASGWTYLYSDTFVSAKEAGEKSFSEQVRAKIATKVRADSEAHVRLTPVDSLAELLADVPKESIETYTAAMADDEKYQDIKQLHGPTGIAYSYSDRHMTANYAALLARVEAKDPYRTIADTVREESRIYPRPTKVALFYEPVFQIDADMMEAAVEGMLQREEYKDIKKIIASTGAVYLYSDLYMPAAQAKAIVQWEEVDKALNP